MQQANTVGLDETYAKKVRAGTIDIETIKDKDLADKIQKYQEYFDKATDSTSSFLETTEKLYNLPLDKDATKIEKLNDAIDLLDKKLDNAIGYKAKNKLVDKQSAQEKKTLTNYKTAGTETAKSTMGKSSTLANSGVTAKKACVLQRTVSTSLNNLFALPEFEPLYEKFALFNYIRIRTEDEILKLRLIGIEFSGDSVEEIQVTFSEQIESIDGKMTDLRSIIQQASSMATSFPSAVLQAKKGAEAQNTVSDMFNNVLSAAKTMLSNNDNNEVTVTSAGILCKRMDDEGYYTP